MANKRTFINADEELVIQGKLTIEGEFVQKEFIETVSFTESKFAGDVLVINSDGFDLTDNPTNASLRLRYGNANSDIVWDGSHMVFSEDVFAANIISTGDFTGNLIGTAANATVLETARTFSITGDGEAPAQSFDGSSNTVLTLTLDTVNANPGAYGDSATVPVISVNGKGLVTSSSETFIDINSGQVNDFEFSVRSNVSAVMSNPTTGDGNFTYNDSTGVFTYTGPTAGEVRAHFSASNGVDYDSTTGAFQSDVGEVRGFFSHVDNGGDGSFSYNSSTGVFTYTGPSASEVRAHFSASNGVDYDSATGAFQAVESEIQHDSLDGFVADEHVAHSSVTLTAGAGLTGGGDITSSRTFNVGAGDGITVNPDSVQVNSTVVRTAGEQFIDGVKHFNDGIIMASNIIPDSGNIYSLGSWDHHFDYVFANVLHAESLDLGDANIHDIHATFDSGIRTVGMYADNTAEGLRFTHNTTGASYAVSTGDGLEIDGVHVAVDNTVLRTNVDQTMTSVTTVTGTLDLSSATVPGFTVAGDLTVEGTFNSQNTVDTYVVDQKITLNANALVDNSVEIVSNRPQAVAAGGSDTSIRWNENIDKWQFTNDGGTYQDLLTDQASRELISVANQNGFGNLAYNNTTGIITHVGTSQQDIRDQFSTVGAGIDYDPSAGEFSANISGIRTYLTAQTTGGDGSLTYNNATGVFTYTGPNQAQANARITAAPDQVRSHFSAGTAITLVNGVISLGTVPNTVTFTEGAVKILNGSIGIGDTAGTFDAAQTNAIAIGNTTGSVSQDEGAIAIGASAGDTRQYRDSVAIGTSAGSFEQGVSAGAGRSVAVGFQSGQTSQGGQALALGESSGLTHQGEGAVAIGTTAGAVYQGAHAVAIGPEAGKGTGSPFTSQPPNSIVIRAGNASYPAVTGSNVGAFYVSPIRHNSDDTSNVLMYNFDEKEVTSVASTIFVSSTANQTVSGTKTFSGELIIPGSSATTEGAIYYDNSVNDAYIYINGVAKKITPAVDAGDVEAVGAGTYDVYAGTRTDGPTTYHGIKSINDSNYTTITESANVLTIDADISAIRGAFSAVDTGGDGAFSYNSGTGAFTYTGPSASEVRSHLSASGLLSYNSTTGVFTTTADNFGNWNFRTDSGAGATESVTSNETIVFQGGTNITVTNSGGTITIANDNTADITDVNAGAGLTGGGSSGGVTLNVVGGDGIIANPNNVIVDATVVRTNGNQTIAGNKTFTGDIQVESLNIANNYDLPIVDGSQNQVLATDGNGNLSFRDVTTIGGTITGVTAGDGLTGGGIAGTVTLDVGAGTGITVNANNIAVDMSAFDTGDLSEGTNQYFTTARARSSLSGSSGVNYNSTTGAITADAGEIRSLFSASGDISYNSATGQFSFTNDAGDIESVGAGNGLTGGGTSGAVTLNVGAGTGITVAADSIAVNMGAFDTGDLAEGTNLYYTNARARAAISVSGDLSYNSSTGVISYSRGPGDIESVGAGTGLTGGGSSGAVTLNVVGGSGITANANDIAIDYDGLAGDMLPTTDSTYDLGSDSKRWAQGWFDDVYTAEIYSGTTTTGTTSAALTIEAQAINNTTSGSVDRTAGSTTVHGGNSFAFNSNRDAPGEPFSGMGGIGGDLNLYGGSGSYINGDVNIGTSQTRYIYLDNNRWPTSTGSNGQVLTVGGSGVLSWQTPTVGDITGVTAGTNLNGGGTSGSVTVNLDTTLSGMTAATFSGTVSANLFSGTATSARYADLAEKYESDATYECGTVVVYGGEKEITVTDQENDHRVAGVISTDPAYMMNSEADGQYVALRGRVPCKVIGPVKKGDVLITSNRPGFAMASDQPHAVSASCMVGKSLQDFDGTEGVVEVVV